MPKMGGWLSELLVLDIDTASASVVVSMQFLMNRVEL